MTDAEKLYQLKMVVALLQDADAMLQAAIGASDECYYIHTQIENAADDVQDIVSSIESGDTDKDYLDSDAHLGQVE